MKMLIAYESKTGQTKKIAECIEKELEENGWNVDLVDTRHSKDSVNIEAYDGVIVGGPVYASHYPGHLTKWVQKNANKLVKVPGAFFSVCLGILQKGNAKVQADEKKIVDDLLDSSGWHPKVTKIFPGILAYTKYNWLVRFMMKRITAKAGGATDTSRDYEYTDWNEVRQFAREFSGSLSPA